VSSGQLGGVERRYLVVIDGSGSEGHNRGNWENWRQTGSSPLLRISNYYEQDGPLQTVWETFRRSMSFLKARPPAFALSRILTAGHSLFKGLKTEDRRNPRRSLNAEAPPRAFCRRTRSEDISTATFVRRSARTGGSRVGAFRRTVSTIR
jgi:hypothetical protein